MTAISDFNRIDDCDKIDPRCINAEARLEQSGETTICLYTSWGDTCVDLTDIVQAAETCTTLYLSPDINPNCLVYEPECGDNICITGDALSRIISMTKLKDVTQSTPIANGYVYQYNGTSNLFEPFDLAGALGGLSGDISNFLQELNNLRNRVVALELKLTPPADAPSTAKVVWGTVNAYYDPNVVMSGGSVTTLDKTHGLYTHTLASNAYGDSIFG